MNIAESSSLLKRLNPFIHEDRTDFKRQCNYISKTDDEKCYACSSEISDQYSFKINNQFSIHSNCLKCHQCERLLDETETCFIKDKRVYCKLDYIRNFSSKCHTCHRSFIPSDLVTRVNFHLFHVGCFKCDMCQKNIVSNQEYSCFQNKIYCAKDYEIIYNKYWKDTKRKKTAKSIGCDSVVDSDEEVDERGEAEQLQRKEKTTRVRTVLNERQLHTLRTCYGANPRPDALLKEQLVEMTGLSPRVIRVWFQNKRCKDKKKAILIKQMQEQQKLRSMSNGALSFVASGPISNSMSANPANHRLEISQIRNPFYQYVYEPQSSSMMQQAPSHQTPLNYQRQKYSEWPNDFDEDDFNFDGFS